MEDWGGAVTPSFQVSGEREPCVHDLASWGSSHVGRRQVSCSDGVAGPSVVGTPPATAPLGERQQTPLPLVQLTGGVRASARLRAQPCAASSASARDVGVTAAARTACQVSLAARPPPGP